MSVPAALAVTLFGPMRILVEGQSLPPLRSRKSLWLLALLVLRHGRPVERKWLADTLWPDTDQERAFAGLRVALSELRKALGGEGVRLRSPDRHTLSLELGGAQVDVLTFDAAITSKQLPALERAVALYTGPLLEGCAEEWAPQERGVREQACLSALQALADAALSAGDHETAAGYYRRAVGMDPWRETAQRGLMEALAKSGDTNAALQVYREFALLLRDDPKAAPDEQTSALYARLRAEARLRAHTPGPVTDAANQVPAPTVTGYLPHPLTDLVGREDERLEVAARLRRARLVTLTGPGGIGKTRLALEVAAEAVTDYADGTWLVALEALSDGNRVLAQIAAVLGLKEETGRTLLQSVTDHLRRKRLLLVLDNCEHLLEASARAAEHLLRECAGVRILATSREVLGVMGEVAWPVPSLAVPDLEHLPTGQVTLVRVLTGYEGVRLFVERAQSVQKTFVLTRGNALAVAQVCSRLAGIPLAIELAAARVKALTVAQIAARLDDHLSGHLGLLTGGSRTAQSRQQTLRATLDWSYDILGEPERVLLGRLSVFAGGWTPEAAEQVCAGTNIEASQILDLITSLVDKSLVVFEERKTAGRYRLLEMVRQYAAQRLEASGQTEQIKARHRDYFLALAVAAEPELTGSDQGVWLERLEAERANLRAALDWCGVEENGAEVGLRLAGALWRFWDMRGHYSEGRAFLSEALGRAGTDGRTPERARALNAAGVLASYQGDSAGAWSLQKESLAIFQELGNRQGVAWSLNDLGDVAGAQGNREAARALYEESLAIFREIGNQQGAASLLHHLGRVVREQGDYGAARALYEESLAIFRELGNRQNVAWALHHLGNLASRRGDSAGAWSLQEESLAIFRELGNRQGAGWALSDLGDVAGAQGNREAARALYEESLAIFREIGNQQGVALLLHHLGGTAREQGDYGAARALYEESLAIFRELGNRQGVGQVLNDLGRVALDQGRFASARTLYAEGISILQELEDRRGVAVGMRDLATVLVSQTAEKAARLWGAAEALRAGIGEALLPGAGEIHDRRVGQVQALLGADTFAAAWEEGRALTWEQAITVALEDHEPAEAKRDTQPL